MTAARPLDRQTIAALRVVGRELGCQAAYVDGRGRFVFVLGGAWALRFSPDSAGRFRLEACYGSTEVGRLWSLASDLRRLADLAQGLRQEIEALTAQGG
jgi:hypothetical protein